jgi:protein involved in polysaccharide export with SLBB domain
MQMLQKLFFLFSILILSQHLMAQVPADQDFLIKTELDKRGLSEAEADAALLAKGLDVKKMSPEEALSKRTEILGVLDELATAKKPAQEAKVEEAVLVLDTIQIKKESAPAAPAPAAPITIYGHQLFKDGGLPVQAITDGASAPETYVLGAGDQIRITIFGISQADLLLTINEAGFVSPAGLAQIYLKGLTLREARKVVRNRFSVAYRFQSDEFAVTLQKARTLNVNIFGEVAKAGSVQLSALNTALNALMAAGGVSEIGSVRHIELMRGDIRKKIDLYAFLNNPSVQFQYDLQHNDILYVPVAQKVVNLEGAVKRPMRYELAGKEGLKELIAFAGGVLYNANIDLIQVERQTGAAPILTEYRLNEVLEGKVVVELLDGDIIRLRPSAVPLEQITSVEGAVYYPGNFAWKEGQKLTDVLAKAQLKPQTSTELFFVERTLTDGTKKLYKVAGKDAAAFAMAAKDRVLVYDQSTYANQLPLEVSGAVRAPFKQLLAYTDQILLSEALALAKGTLPTTADWAYVRRPNLFEPNQFSYVRINLKDSLNFALGAGDVLMVYDKDIYTQAANISIGGAVRNPINTPFSEQLSIADLVNMAGRTTEKSNLSRVDIFRLRYNDKRGSGYELIRVGLDSNYNVVGNAGFALLPFDQIIIRELSQFEKDKAVSVQGEVKFPGAYAMPVGTYRLADLIKDAGGLSAMASKDVAILLRSAGDVGLVGLNLKKALNRKHSKKWNPFLLSGDVLTVFPIQNTFSIRTAGTNYPVLDTTLSEVSFVFSGAHSARWYLREYAGGLQEDADRRTVAVSYPNGRVDGTQRFLYLFNNMPTVKSGGQIVVNMKAPEEIQEKKDIDYDAIFTRSFQAISSMLTISLLIKQL